MSSAEILHTARGDFEVLVDGPDDGAVVLLLHGFPELSVSWRHQLPALAAAGYRAVAPNQRGYGGSVRGGSYLTSDLAADVVAMIDALGVQRVTLVGHDLGGVVAWTTAALHPERVEALVALNCPPPRVLAAHLLRSPAQLRKSWYMFFFQLPVLPERFVSQNMPKVLVAGSYNRAVWNRELLTPYAEAFATPDDAAGPVNWYRGAFRDALRRPRRRMTRLAMPVLVIWGVHDQFLGRGLVEPESLLGTLAYGNVADVIDVADAGHFVQNEAPDAVNEALLAWLGQRDGAPA